MFIFSNFIFNESNINELLVKLTNDYPIFFQEPERIKDILSIFNIKSTDSITIIIEDNYVDKQYRDSYYFYFAQKYRDFERNCMRMSFFEGNVAYKDFMFDILEIQKNFIGTIVLRPLTVGNIGHTLLDPHKLKLSGSVQTCEFKLMICGRKLTIRAFPYLSQDNETMTCAETALFNLIQYYSEKYCEYRIFMPSEILSTLESSTYERVLPSNGIDDANMAKILQYGHFYPRLYTCEPEDWQNFEEILYIYIESGIPFILGLPQHAVICIGHGSVDYKIENHEIDEIVEFVNVENKLIYHINIAKLIDEYIFMDDNEAPYLISTIDDLTVKYFQNRENSEYYNYETDIYEEENIDLYEECEQESTYQYTKEALIEVKSNYDVLLVPLYKRIFIDAPRAKSIFEEYFIHNPDFIHEIQKAYDDNSWGTSSDNPLLWRMYLASSNSYKDFRCRTAPNIDTFNYYSSESYPRFIWVLEIGNIDTCSKKKSRVEIILDATSSKSSGMWTILSIRYKKHLVYLPHILKNLNNDYNTVNNTIKSDNEDYANVDFESLNVRTDQKGLTEVFKTLYYKTDPFIDDTYDIFLNQNLKEI